MAAKDPRSPSNEPSGSGRGSPGKADWRRPASYSAPAPAARKKAGRGWIDRPDRAYEDARRWYRIRLASWALAAVALFVVFFIIIIYWPRRTPMVAMAVTGYSGRDSLAVPPNGWANEDVDRFDDLDTQEKILDYAKLPFVSARAGEAAFDEMREQIRERSKWWKFGYPIIVYLSAHGVVNADGKPCLLLPGNSPLASDKWLPLEKVLAHLFPAEAQQALPAKKLLILDCNRMDVNYPLGLLYNSFADGLDKVVKSANIPGLAILNSTSPGQIGWTSPEQLHGSVFAFFVQQGLRGTADRRDAGGNGNGKLTLQELHKYVAKHVRPWVVERRADIQEPRLFPEDADFFLAHAKKAPLAEIPKEKFDSRSRWKDDIDPLWSSHERLHASSPWRINPLGWEEFQQGLLRLEQLAIAGKSYDEEYRDLKDDLKNKVSRLADPGLPKALNAASIPLRLRLASDGDTRKVEDEQKTLRDQWKWNPKEKRFAAETVPNVLYLAAAAEVWRRCVDGVDGIDSGRWSEMLQFVDTHGRQGRSATDVVEVHFLRMLNAHMDPVTLKDYRVAVDRALAARDLAEKIAAGNDERVHYWIQSAADKADDARRRAEDRLFLGSAEAAREAEQALESLVSSDRKAGAYPKAQLEAEKVAKAFALRDRAWAEIPYYARWLLARQSEPDKRQMQLLDRQIQLLVSLIQDTHALAAELDRVIVKRDFESRAWESSSKTVETGRDELNKALERECTRLLDRSSWNRKTQQAISVVLSVPLVSGKLRQDLWSTYWYIAERVRSGEEERQATAGKPDEKEKAAEGAKTEPSRETYSAAGDRDLVQADTSAYLKRLPASHPVLAVLARSSLGVSDPECLTSASDAAPASGTPDEIVLKQLARLDKQGQCVRELLVLGSVKKQCDALSDQSKSRLDAGDRPPGETREGRAKADRLLRAAAPLMDLARSPWPKPEDDPPHQLRRLDLHYLLVWQGYRTLEDFWGPWPPPPPDAPRADKPPGFFATAADQYLNSADALLEAKSSRLRYSSPALKEPVDLRGRLEALKKVAGKVVEANVPDLTVKKADPAGSKTQEATTPGDISAVIADSLPEGTAALYIRNPDTSNRLEQTIPMRIRRDDGVTKSQRISAAVKSGQSAPQQPFSVLSDDLQSEKLPHDLLDAVGLYRGHEYVTSFSATPPDYELEYKRSLPVPPTITVNGEALEEPCPVVFILDCSGSMDHYVLDPWEPKPGMNAAAAAQLKRFAVARHALEQILERLAKSEVPYEVGFIAYGHRVGWGDPDPNTRKQPMVIWDPKIPLNTMERPADYPVLPSEDVQVIRSPSPFGAAELKGLAKELGALNPLGETPLYMAIQRAVMELQSKRPAGNPGRSARRHILVITDGMNEVFGTEGKRVYKSDLSELFQRPENRDITLDVIGFNLNDWDLLWERVTRSDNANKLEKDLKARKDRGDTALAAAASVDPALAGRLKESQALRAELDQLLDETRHPAGSKGFYPVAGATGITQVIEALQQSLNVRRAKYTVERISDGKPVATAELNETVTLDKEALPQRYLIKVGSGDRPVSTEVTLEGGESEMIDLSKDGTRLEHQRYDKNLRRDRPDVADPADPENTAKRFFIGAHIPDWKESKVQFEISIQNNDAAKFSPRPEEAWIQVRPLVPEGSAEPYVVYDLTYVPKVPVPVLTFTAPNWPAKAEEAEIQLWFKLKKTAPAPREVKTVDDLGKLGALRLQDVPTATFSVRTRPSEQGPYFPVEVRERYERGKPILGVRVEMDPMPERITRQYKQKASTVIHTFYYESAVAPQAGTFRILLTPHSRLAERAVTLRAPLKIPIARQSR